MFKRKQKDSLIEDLDYKIEPKDGEKYYVIMVKRKSDREYIRITEFLKNNHIDHNGQIYCTCHSVEEGEETLKLMCEFIVKWERGEIKNRETVTGDLKELYIIESL